MTESPRGWATPSWLQRTANLFGWLGKRHLKDKSPEFRLHMYSQTLDRSIRNYGPESRPTANARALLAGELEAVGRFSEAQVLREQVLATYRAQCGQGDRNTLMATLLMANNLRMAGMRSAAEALVSAVLETSVRLYGRRDQLSEQANGMLISIGDEENPT